MASLPHAQAADLLQLLTGHGDEGNDLPAGEGGALEDASPHLSGRDAPGLDLLPPAPLKGRAGCQGGLSLPSFAGNPGPLQPGTLDRQCRLARLLDLGQDDLAPAGPLPDQLLWDTLDVLAGRGAVCDGHAAVLQGSAGRTQ